MRNLLVFFVRHYFFLLFLALESFAVIMLVQNNYFHRAGFMNSSNAVVGEMLEARDEVTQYFHLKEDNEQLSKQNAFLLSRQASSFAKFTGTSIQVKDTIYKQQFEYMEAGVVDNTVYRRNNYLTLNRGSLQGVKPGMGVIGPEGVVGKVLQVSDNFCTVMSLLHKEAKVSSRLKSDGTFGPVSWDDASNYRSATLRELPTHAKIKKGDTLFTSGIGDTYPAGIPVGIVESFGIKSGDQYYTAKVNLTTDFKALQYVFIVKYLFKDEKDKLQQETLKNAENAK
ncbi:MAG: rod shape-determining protein MreC [Bacteroidetes bacterium]|nr:MAG: rod shape-determining protein MreC [Bacteroidota bacterium]